MTTVGQSVKEERHDEQEIAELAAKMVEAHKIQAAKQVTQQLNNQALLASNSLSNIQGGSILNYLQRKPIAMAQPILQQTSTTNGNHNGTSVSVIDESKPPADEESLKGHFGWESFNSGKVHIPYIIRQSEKYCAVRIVEQKLLNKYLNVLHQDLYNCTNIRSYYITEVEARLLDEINYRHCDQVFGKDKFSAKDLIVRLSDAQKFQQFLEVCYRKLTNYSTPNDKCGFIRINSESVVPYTVRDGQKMVPLFYFEGETENLKLKADSLSGWDLSYLKFCCKVQGIRNELFASETVAVISLDDIKSYFPQGTMFEDYWPNKVVDTQLLVAQPKSHGTITWTNPPPKQQVISMQQQRAPTAQPQPQKIIPQSQQQHSQQQQQVQQVQQQRSIPARNNVAALQHMYGNTMNDMNYLRSLQQQSGLTNTQQASLAALAFNGWDNQITQSQMDMFRLASAQSKQGSTNRATYSRQQQQQQQQQHQQQQQMNLLNPALYSSYSNSMSMSSNNGHSRNSSQQPPPLVRSQQSQMSNCGVSGSATSLASTQLRSSANYSQSSSTSSSYPPSYQASSNNVNSSHSKSNNNSVVTITRCPPSNPSNAPFPHTNPSSSSSSNYLNRIPASTTITPTQYYNNKDNSLTSSLSVYPKNSQSGSGRNIIQSSVSPVIASPTRASPQAGYAKQPSVSPASPMHSLLPDVIQQQLNELLKTNYPNQNQDLLKETLLSQYSLYARAQQAAAAAGNQSSSQNPPTYPIRNKSVITTSRESPMDVIDVSSNSPTPSRSGMAAVQQALELQHAASISAANKRAYNGQYINGNQSSARSMQSSSSTSSSRLQQQMDLNGYGMSAYKVEKAYIEAQPVSVVKMLLQGSLTPEIVFPLSELRDQFYPNANLEICRRVLETLGITLIPGNKLIYQAYAIAGKTVQDNVPFVRTSDFKAYLAQINYMIRGHLQEYRNTSKRTRIS